MLFHLLDLILGHFFYFSVFVMKYINKSLSMDCSKKVNHPAPSKPILLAFYYFGGRGKRTRLRMIFFEYLFYPSRIPYS